MNKIISHPTKSIVKVILNKPSSTRNFSSFFLNRSMIIIFIYASMFSKRQLEFGLFSLSTCINIKSSDPVDCANFTSIFETNPKVDTKMIQWYKLTSTSELTNTNAQFNFHLSLLFLFQRISSTKRPLIS